MSPSIINRTLAIVALVIGCVSVLLGFFDYMPGYIKATSEGEALRRSVYFAAFLGFGGLCFVTAAILHCFPLRASD
jgi:hypothetical protein